MTALPDDLASGAQREVSTRLPTVNEVDDIRLRDDAERSRVELGRIQ
jgi:hypothetical protein